MDDVQYLSITISAICSNCGAKTTDAEGDNWARFGDVPYCRDCADEISRINEAIDKLHQARSYIGNPNARQEIWDAIIHAKQAVAILAGVYD